MKYFLPLLLFVGVAAEPPVPRVQWIIFTADWCEPCVSARKDYRSFFERLKPRLMVSPVPHADLRLIDVDLEKEMAQQWDVESVPQFVLLVDGKPVERHWRYPGKKRLHEAYQEAVKELK